MFEVEPSGPINLNFIRSVPTLVRSMTALFQVGGSFVVVCRIVAVAVACVEVGFSAFAACAMGTRPVNTRAAAADGRQFMTGIWPIRFTTISLKQVHHAETVEIGANA
jgi:hypothetical protein